MSETDGDLPPVIDVYDMLDRIERDADNDEEVPAHLDEIRDLLAEYARRDRSGRASLVDDIDGRVLAVREYLDGDADRWAEGVENRLRVYRDSLREASDRLHLANARLEADGEPLDGAVGEHADGTVALRGTLVNQGDAGDGVVRLVFYDGDGTATWKVESRQFGVDAGERRDLDMRVYVPADAAYCDVTALDAADPETATL